MHKKQKSVSHRAHYLLNQHFLGTDLSSLSSYMENIYQMGEMLYNPLQMRSYNDVTILVGSCLL